MAKAISRGKLVMVADDDEDLSFLLEAQLKQLGYKVQKCMAGHNLVAEVRKYKPFLLLLDIAMQSNDGGQLCEELKKDFTTNATHILLMSGNHNIAEIADTCGADGYISKPLTLRSIADAVNKYV